MTRSSAPYADGGPVPVVEGAIDVTTPVAGYYRMRLRSGGMQVGIRLWYGQPADPVTGELMDRSLRWQATANGEPIDFDRAWPKCAADPIDKAEHDHMVATQAWAREHAPNSPQADPRRKIDLLSAPIPI